MDSLQVLVLYNEPVLPQDHPHAEAEHEVLGTVEFIGQALAMAGHQVESLGIGHDPEPLLAGLRERRPDAVFNLFEGTADQGNTEAYVAGLLEWMHIPFTGCPSSALSLARSKHLTKHVLQGAALPTPSFLVVEDLPVPECLLRWPVIVKPATRDASEGLDQGSVVVDQVSLAERVTYIWENYGAPVLIEEFIRGRELDVALVEIPDLRILPISEIDFQKNGPDYWPILTYDAKWKPESREFEATPPLCPAIVSPGLTGRLETLARRAFQLLGCRGYARVDFRVRPSGKPYILEVNPNPDLHPTAGFTRSLAAAGINPDEFANQMVQVALTGSSPTPPTGMSVPPAGRVG